MKKLIVFASGGGSGFQELVENARTGILKAEIVAVVSNHEFGGVREKAEKLKIPFIFFSGPFTRDAYQEIVASSGAEFVALSGWLKQTVGLNPRMTINIHPGALPRFGGKGMYGVHVHEAVIKAYQEGDIKHAEVSMHFVTEEYDEGPVFFRYPVLIRDDDTAETLAARVNKIEHCWQSWITNLVIEEQISWDGKNPESLQVSPWYHFHDKL